MGGVRLPAIAASLLLVLAATATTADTTNTVTSWRALSGESQSFLPRRAAENQPFRALHGAQSAPFTSQDAALDRSRSDVVQVRLEPDTYVRVRTLKGMGKEGMGGMGMGDGMGDGMGKKGKSMGKSKGGSKGGNGLPSICTQFDFGSGDDAVSSDDDAVYGGGKGGGGKGGGDESDGGGMGKRKNRLLPYGSDSSSVGFCDTNVLDTARENINLSIFVSLVEAANLQNIFQCPGPFTVLAPSNEAFTANPSILDYLGNPANVMDLRRVLLYHILPGRVLTSDFTTGPTETLNGDVVQVTLNPIMFNSQASIVTCDISACNGVIDIIDNILLPPGTCTHSILAPLWSV